MWIVWCESSGVCGPSRKGVLWWCLTLSTTGEMTECDDTRDVKIQNGGSLLTGQMLSWLPGWNTWPLSKLNVNKPTDSVIIVTSDRNVQYWITCHCGVTWCFTWCKLFMMWLYLVTWLNGSRCGKGEWGRHIPTSLVLSFRPSKLAQANSGRSPPHGARLF